MLAVQGHEKGVEGKKLSFMSVKRFVAESVAGHFLPSSVSFSSLPPSFFPSFPIFFLSSRGTFSNWFCWGGGWWDGEREMIPDVRSLKEAKNSGDFRA